MKNQLITLTIALLMTVVAQAQTETLFGRTRVVGGFGAVINEIGLNNDLSTAVGGGGAIVINSFFLGGYGVGTVDFNELLKEEEIESLELGHGGIWLGFNILSHKLVHFYASTRVGWGAIDITLQDNVRVRDLDQVFLLTPEAGIELNVTRWFRLAGTVGYRYLDGANEERGYTNDDFKGAFAGITLRFGGFGNYRQQKDGW